MWLEQLLSRWCHDFGVTGLWSDNPRHNVEVGRSGFASPWTAAATRGRLGPDRDGWTPARVQVELEKHNKKAGASAGLRTKVSAIQGRERLSISMSTAHYRQSRFEQAGDPIPFFRVWARMLCAAGLRIDEACRPRRCNIDIVAKRVHVGQAKTDAGGRAVQLTPDTFATSGATWS